MTTAPGLGAALISSAALTPHTAMAGHHQAAATSLAVLIPATATELAHQAGATSSAATTPHTATAVRHRAAAISLAVSTPATVMAPGHQAGATSSAAKTRITPAARREGRKARSNSHIVVGRRSRPRPRHTDIQGSFSDWSGQRRCRCENRRHRHQNNAPQAPRLANPPNQKSTGRKIFGGAYPGLPRVIDSSTPSLRTQP